MLHFRRKKIQYCWTSLGIFTSTNDITRFVQGDIEFSAGFDLSAIYGDTIFQWRDFCAQSSNAATIYRHTPFNNQLFSCSPGTNPGFRKKFLETDQRLFFIWRTVHLENKKENPPLQSWIIP